MRDPTELTEAEAELVHRLIEAYPGALGYVLDRDPSVFAIAAELIEEGRVERLQVADGVAYRLTDGHAAEVRQIAADRAGAAPWN